MVEVIWSGSVIEVESYQVSRIRRCWHCLRVVDVELEVVDEREAEWTTD